MIRYHHPKKLSFVLSVLILLSFLPNQIMAQDALFPKNLPMKYWTYEQFKAWLKWDARIELMKPSGPADRREGIMDGNKIRTVFYNYGSIGRPNTEPSIEWPKGSGHGYGLSLIHI